MTKQQTIDTLKQQLPGFYSVEQVIEMISKIEESEGFKMPNEEQIKELVGNIVDEITDLGHDAISDYDLSMNGREVEIDSIDFDDYSIRSTVNDVINSWIEGIYEEEENS